jgi:hypothetical protein
VAKGSTSSLDIRKLEASLLQHKVISTYLGENVNLVDVFVASTSVGHLNDEFGLS